MDSPTATRMPGSTPSRATPSNATMDSQNSVLRRCHNRRVPATSASEIAAPMTMAPSTGWGTYCISPVAKTRTTVITTAPTRPVSWELAPACSATAVREPLVLTGKPWKRPAAMFAAPMPIISWFPRTCSPRLAANDEAVDIVSASATTAIAKAPMSSGGTSLGLTSGRVNGGNPCGRTPIVSTPLDSRSSRFTAMRTEYDDDQDAGELGQQTIQQQDADQGAHPDGRGGRIGVTVGQADREPLRLGQQSVGIDGETEQLGQLPDHDGDGQPVHVADLRRLREQVRHEPETGQPGDGHQHTDEHGKQGREGDSPRRVPTGQHQGKDRGRDHRAER